MAASHFIRTVSSPLKVSLISSNPNPVIGEDITLNCTWNLAHHGSKNGLKPRDGHRSESSFDSGPPYPEVVGGGGGMIKMRHGGGGGGYPVKSHESSGNNHLFNGMDPSLMKEESRSVMMIDEIIFLHNMKRINFDHRIRKISENIIQIRSFRFSDNGIYQCFVATTTSNPSPFYNSDNSNLFHHEWNHGDVLLHLPG